MQDIIFTGKDVGYWSVIIGTTIISILGFNYLASKIKDLKHRLDISELEKKHIKKEKEDVQEELEEKKSKKKS